MSMSGDDHMPTGVAGSVRRVEVFTGAGRRRDWSSEQKAAIIAESYCGDVSVCDVARRHGLTPSQLFTWRRNARQQGASKGKEPDAFFVPAVVDEDAGTSAAVCAEETVSKPAPILELDIDGSSVRVWSGAQADLVTAVVRALKGIR